MSKFWRKPTIVSVIVVVPLLSLGILVAWFFGIGTPTGQNLPRPFQSSVWKSADGFNTKVRCSMVSDLRHRVDLVGRSRADVIKLLGPDQTRDIHPHEAPSSAEPKLYVLCPDFPDWMVMTLEWQNGRVTNTDVWQT
jgi:hypothetical protein